jgi:hypothetical protein
MSKARKVFVKSANTSTQPASSKKDIDVILRRYGATAISISENIEAGEITVAFVLPDSPASDAPRIPVKLPISVRRVYDMLYGRPTKWIGATNPGEKSRYIFNPKGYDAKKLEQAERVAWRNLVLWIDAALSAAVAGLQTISESFFAHTVVGAGGERLIQVVEAAQSQLGPGVQRLLTAPADDAS